MEVHFTPQTEAQLKQFAASKGKNVAQVVEEIIARMLEREAQFVEGVKSGIEAADRGDLIDHEEVVNRIERLFQSRREYVGPSKLQIVYRLKYDVAEIPSIRHGGQDWR